MRNISSRDKRTISGFYDVSSGSLIRKQDFSVDKTHTFKDITFENCNFFFKLKTELTFISCSITDCVFIGLANESPVDPELARPSIKIENTSSFDNNLLGGDFANVIITNSTIKRLNDRSSSLLYNIENTTVLNADILGSCKVLILNEVVFISGTYYNSIWNKSITQKAVCVNVIFDHVRINPFFLATKCHDKSSLDLSGATLVDDWSRLRKKYAGLSLFIVFLLTFFFFLPIFTHSFFLIALSKIEVSPFYEKIPLWKALIYGGKHGYNAIIYLILTIVLLLYNIGRIYMTISISRLREEENFLKDSDFNSISIHPEKYKKQLIVDKILSWMFWISIGYTILKLIDTLMIAVPQ